MSHHLTRKNLSPLRISRSKTVKTAKAAFLPPISSALTSRMNFQTKEEIKEAIQGLNVKENKSEDEIEELKKLTDRYRQKLTRKMTAYRNAGLPPPEYSETTAYSKSIEKKSLPRENTSILLDKLKTQTSDEREIIDILKNERIVHLPQKSKGLIEGWLDELTQTTNNRDRTEIVNKIDDRWFKPETPKKNSPPIVRSPPSAKPPNVRPPSARPQTVKPQFNRASNITHHMGKPREVDVTGNGNCFYYAIYEALNSLNAELTAKYTGREDFNINFRQSIITELKKNKSNLYESGQFQLYIETINPHIVEAYEFCKNSGDINCEAARILEKINNSMPMWIIQTYLNIYIKALHKRWSTEEIINKFIDAYIDGVKKNQNETTGIEEEMAKAILLEQDIILKLINTINRDVIFKDNIIYLINKRNHWKYIAFASNRNGGKKSKRRLVKKRKNKRRTSKR
jgi:hypothetical protein